MKTLSLLLLFLLAFTGLTRADDTEAVQAQVRGFYHWYVHALNAKANAMPEKSAEAHRYVSARFLKEIAREEKSPDGLESDPFMRSQDWDPAWEKIIRIKDSRPDGALWKVKVILGGGGEMAPQPLNLVMVREGNAWKIDKVSDGDTH